MTIVPPIHLRLLAAGSACAGRLLDH